MLVETEAVADLTALEESRNVVRAFTSRTVCTLTGLTPRQLQYWDEKAFVPPSLRRRKGPGRRRLYDFRDLVSLRVASDLRRQGISLQLIRKVVAYLRHLDYAHPLAEIRFWSVDGRLYFNDADTVREGARPSQTIVDFLVPVGEIVRELDTEIVKLDERRAVGTVERRRGVLGSEPVIAGTRITVESVQRLHDDGAGEDEILQLYPDLTAADVHAALAEERKPRRASAV